MRPVCNDLPSGYLSRSLRGCRAAIIFFDAIHAVLDPHGQIYPPPEMVLLPIVLAPARHFHVIFEV